MILLGIMIWLIGVLVIAKMVPKMGYNNNDHILPILLWPISIWYLFYLMIFGNKGNTEFKNRYDKEQNSK